MKGVVRQGGRGGGPHGCSAQLPFAELRPRCSAHVQLSRNFLAGDRVDAIGPRRYCRTDMKIQVLRLIAVSSLLLISACFRPDRRSLKVSVPQMKSQDCANLVVASFKQGQNGAVEGIYKVTPDLSTHTVVVEFDPQKLGFKNVEVTIASAGFDANDVLANPEAKAKLPPECR